MACISALELHYDVIIMPCVKNCCFTWLTPGRLGVSDRSLFSSPLLGVFSIGPGMEKAFSKSFLNR